MLRAPPRLSLQALIVGFVAYVTDIVACLHIRTLVSGAMLLAVGTVILLHLAQFPSWHWFSSSTSPVDRFVITLAGALGAGLGTLTVLLCS